MSFSTEFPIKLIVNADDVGRTEKVNAGVEEAFRNGLVSSTSMVANSPAFLEAVKMVHRNPNLDTGIHLTLHEYPPLSENAFLKQLSRSSMLSAFGRVIFSSTQEVRWIEEEFRRQIERILSHGVRLSHMDGHNHYHVHPRLIGVLARLSKDYSIPWIRLPAEALFHPGDPARALQKVMLTGVCRFDALFLKNKVSWPDRFHGFSEGGNMNRSRLLRILNNMKPGLNELMCHVGTENDDPPFHIGYHWLDELNTMTTFSKKQIRDQFGIQVVSYLEVHDEDPERVLGR